MTEQHALWEDEPWTSEWKVGDKVRSRYTNNTGTVTLVDYIGRHLLIHWDAWRNEPDGYTARHSSPNGLERLS